MITKRHISTISIVSRSILIPAALLFTLLFIACGELSMYEILAAEQPGNLAMAQSELNLPPEAEYLLVATGGFKPYRFQIVSDPGGGTLANGALYRAPSQPTEDQVMVTDRFGSTAVATVRVFPPLRATPTSITLGVGETRDIRIIGGLGTINYAAHGQIVLDSSPETRTPEEPAILRYTAPIGTGNGADQIEITDEYGSTALVTVTIYQPGELRLDPPTGTIQTGQSILLTVSGGEKPIGPVEILPPYSAGNLSFESENQQITFNHPGGGILDDAHITVTDASSRTVSATIFVIDGDPGSIADLTISPYSGNVEAGTTVEFTASGGIPRYTFELVVGSGQLIPVGENKVRYTVSFPPGVAQIRLTDRTGEHVTAKLNVIK
jgi:hypothetical protein